MRLRSARLAQVSISAAQTASAPKQSREKRKKTLTDTDAVKTENEDRMKKEDHTTTTTITKTETVIVKNSNKKQRKADEPPIDWKETFEKIKEYRQQNPAVVDTMGCERLAQRDIPLKQQRFQTLVALMLSSQTKDTVTSAAIKTLQADLPGGLSLQSILLVDEAQLDNYIRSVGFHTKKAAYIKKTACILRDQYDGDIPDTIEGLMSLPGVGPKMGYLALQCAWQKNMGIGVDVHVHRIANRLGWCRTEKGGPEDTRMSLQSWLPMEHWREINPMLVGFGQIMCLPRNPKCGECPVIDLCPSSTVKTTRKKQQKHTIIKRENIDAESIQTKDIKQESVYFNKGKDDIGYQTIKKENLDW